MILIDSNVVGEVTRTRPAPDVLDWFTRHAPLVAVPTVVLHEAIYGVERLVDPEKRSRIRARLDALWDMLDHRFVAFDAAAAVSCGGLRGSFAREGLAISLPDAQIAATCLSRRLPLASRDRAFARVPNLTLIDPWND